MSENPLKGYYLTRVYTQDGNPFQTVMDLVREEAAALCKRVTPNRRVGGAVEEADQQIAYIDARVGVEDWARESAKAVGVEIKKEHPIYFTLTAEPETSAPGRKVISIPAENIDLSCCSFTYGDSFNNSPKASPAAPPGKPTTAIPDSLHGTVFNAVQMKKVVEKYGVPGIYEKGQNYIEVQMWARPPLNILNDVATPQAKPQPPTARKMKTFPPS